MIKGVRSTNHIRSKDENGIYVNKVKLTAEKITEELKNLDIAQQQLALSIASEYIRLENLNSLSHQRELSVLTGTILKASENATLG